MATTNTDIIVQARLDQSADAIKKLKDDISKIESKLKNSKIKIAIELDDEIVQKLKNQFTEIQQEVTKLRNVANFDQMANDLKQGIAYADQMREAMAKMNKEAELVSNRSKFNLLTGHDIQQVETYRRNLLETIKVIKSYDKDGNLSSKVAQVDTNYSQAQKSLYSDIAKLQGEIFAIQKQMIKADDEQQAKLQQQVAIREELIGQIQNTISQYNLVNQTKEQELKLARELKEVQLEIAKTKDVDSRSQKVYAELTRLAKEEASIQKATLNADGEHLNILQQKLEIIKSAQEALSQQVKNKESVVYNEERHNQLLQQRKKLELDIQAEQERLSQKEALRLAKLGSEYATVDFNAVPFENDQAIRDYITSIEGAKAEITSFSRTVDGAGNNLIKMTVTTQTSSNKIKQMKLVVDEASGSIRKMSEATKLNSNRMLGIVEQMGEAFKKSITWAISMDMIYGNLRRLKEGIKIVTELDAELTQVAITTGMTREETKKLAHEYAELGMQMGKTVKEISAVNTELVRQGLSTQESMERLQTVLKLSATEGIDTTTTLSILTSSVNALGEEAEKTADVLLKASQISASSAEGIGEALTKTASSARSVDMTIEELSAVISTLVDVTQESPSSLGNSLKTLIARFNEVDEITGEVNQDFNKVQEAFESVGIEFLDTQGQIKPFFTLLEEMAGKWDDLDKNTKMYIATQSAGVRQANRFLAIMNNFNRVQDIHNQLLDSGGTLNQSYAKYLDSVEASANRARASFEEMWISAINSETIKQYYDAVTAITQFISRVGVLKVGLTGLNFVLLLCNKSFRGLLDNGVSRLGKGLESVRQLIKTTQASTASLAVTNKATASSFNLATMASTFFGTALQGITLKAILAKVAVLGLKAVLTGGLAIAITFVVDKIVSWIGASERARQEAEMLAETTKANIQTHQENIRTLKSLKGEFEQLNEKLGENRDFTKLTAEEQERYNSIVSQLEQIAPEVVKAYDEKGNAIVDYKTKIEDLIEKEKELIDLEKSKIISSEKDIVKGVNKEVKKKQKEIDKLDKEIAIYQGALNGESPAQFYADNGYYKVLEIYNKSIGEQRAELTKLHAQKKVLLQDIKSEQSELEKLIDVYFTGIDGIENLNDSFKEMARQKVSETLNAKGYEEAVEQVGQFQVAFEKMTETVNASNLDDTTGEVLEVRNALGELGYTTEEIDMILYEFVHTLETSEEVLGRVATAVSTTSDEFKEFMDTIKKLDGIMNTLMSGDDLSTDELMNLVDNYDEIAEYIAETGDLTLKNGELIKELREEQIKLLYEELELEMQRNQVAIDNGREELAIQQQKLEEIERRFGTENRLYQQQAQVVNELTEQVKGLEKQLASANVKAKAFNHVFGQNFANTEMQSYANSFKDITSTLEAYRKILEEIDEYGKLSGDTNKNIVQNHQELIHLLGNEAEMREYLLKKISEYEDTQQQAYQNSLMASEYFSKQFFNQNKQLFERIAELYDIDLKNFTTVQELKLKLMSQSMNALSEYGRQWVQATSGGDSLKALEQTKKAYEQALWLKTSGVGHFSGAGTIVQMLGKEYYELSPSELEQKIQQIDALIETQQAWENITSNFSKIDFSSSYKKSSSKGKSYQRIKAVELLTDRYIKFNKALEEVNRSIERNDQILELATGRDRVALLGKEIELLKEKQEILHLTAEESRKERAELEQVLKKHINLNDGTMGADSFKAYTQQMQNSINAIIKQINSTTNDSLRDSLTQQKETMEEAYDKLKESFDRYLELQSEIPNLGVEWWAIEIEKFNKGLEMLDTDLEKYAQQIDHINDQLALMVTIRENNVEEVEREYTLMQNIAKVYKQSLNDINDKLTANAEMIDYYEQKLKSLGDVRNTEYENITRRLVMLRAEQDKLIEAQREGITSLANHLNSLIDNYLSQLDRIKDETIKALENIRRETDKFDRNSFQLSIEQILADLDKIDGIFRRGVDFKLSTRDARRDLRDWKDTVLDTLDDIDKLQRIAQDIMSIQADTEDEHIDKREQLIELIEEQIGLENELKELEIDLRQELEETRLEYQRIEDALEAQIKAKQEELKQLQEQYEQEDKIRQMLEKQLELMRAMDDRRYSYITGQGEEIFTYDRSRVAELQKEIAQMQREQEREETLKALEDEISQMQEHLATTREIHAQELEVLKLAQQGISGILGVLSDNIEDNLGETGLEQIFEDMGNTFIDSIKEALEPFVDRFEEMWNKFINRVSIDTVKDDRQIDKSKLGKKSSEKSTTQSSSNSNSSQPKYIEYVVKPNDTLSAIARKYNTSVPKILDANPFIKNKDLIYPNQKLKIPQFDTGGYTGEWGSEGRFALVHEKELILNKKDTENLLNSVNIARHLYDDLYELYSQSQVPTTSVVTNNEGSKSVILNNPVFNGIRDVNRFANELHGLFRRGIPTMY